MNVIYLRYNIIIYKNVKRKLLTKKILFIEKKNFKLFFI